MKIRQVGFMLILNAAAVLLATCGSHGPTLPIAVTFTPGFAPPSTMGTGATAGVAATITNGPQNAVVDWSVACGSEPACGSFSPILSASTIPVTYSAPTSIPSGGTVTVTATSANDSTKFVAASITIH